MKIAHCHRHIAKSEYQPCIAVQTHDTSLFPPKDTTQKLNTLTNEKGIEGNGWLFVCAPLGQLECILSAMLPRQYLVTDYNTHRAAVIPQRQMEEFIYLYESMPYNIELMNRLCHPL